MVGREHELEQLRGAYDQAVAERSCRLFTVLGPAGIGKTRLVHELVASAPDGACPDRRCLPYGEGITYLADREVVRRGRRVDEASVAERRARPTAFARLRRSPTPT